MRLLLPLFVLTLLPLTLYAATWQQEVQAKEIDFPTFKAIVKQALEQHDKVKQIDDKEAFTFKITLKSGNKVNINMYDLHKKLPKETEKRPEFLQQFIDKKFIPKKKVERTERESVYPVIRHKSYALKLGKSFKQEKLILWPFTNDLVILFVVDRNQKMKFVVEKDVKRLKIKPDNLLQLAKSNLKSYLSEIVLDGDSDLVRMIADRNYESSIMLLDSIWDNLSAMLQDDIVAAIPSREQIYATGANNEKFIKKLRHDIPQVMKTSPTPISNQLYIRRDGKWQVFEEKQ